MRDTSAHSGWRLQFGGQSIFLNGDDMDEFWKEVMNDASIEALRQKASEEPGWDEAVEYISNGVRYLAEHYTDDKGIIGVLMDGDEKDFVTKDGLDHCQLVDAAMVYAVDEQIMTEFAMALKHFSLTDDPDEVFESYRSSLHFALHVGMTLAIGMMIDDGTLDGD
jgi:hypothetical protein